MAASRCASRKPRSRGARDRCWISSPRRSRLIARANCVNACRPDPIGWIVALFSRVTTANRLTRTAPARRLQGCPWKSRTARYRLHDLRHSAASLLLALNIHPRVVMELLGHSQISLTMDTYSHTVPEILRDAIDKLGAALGG
jgi:integrase